MMDIS
jgi:hypothetical protein